jgi:hypothetical protein
MNTRKLALGAVVLVLLGIFAWRAASPRDRDRQSLTFASRTDSRDAPKTPGLIPRPRESRPASRPAAAATSREIEVVSSRTGELLAHSGLDLVDGAEDCVIEPAGPGRWLLRGAPGASGCVSATARDHFAAERRVSLAGGPASLVVALLPVTDLRLLVLESGTGKVVADAALELGAAGPSGPESLLWAARTDAHGAATCPAGVLSPSLRSVVLRISEPAHVPLAWSIRMPSGREVVYLDRGRQIEVAVRDGRGSPIRGASVRCASLSDLRSGPSFHPAVTTDARGLATVFANPGERALAAVVAPGWKPAAAAIGAEEDRVALALGPERPCGIVLKSPTGVPLSHVRVRFVPLLRGQGTGPVEAEGSDATTDEGGMARLSTRIAAVDYLVSIAESPTTTRFSRLVTAADLDALGAVVAPVPRPLAVSVRSSGGTPIAGARVAFVAAEGSSLAEARARGTAASAASVATSPGGAASLLLPEGAAGHVVALKPGFAPAAAPVEAGAPCEITLDPGTPLEVRVQDENGDPYAGATVVLEAPVLTAGTPVRVPQASRSSFEQRAVAGVDGRCELLVLATRSLIRAEGPDDVRSEREIGEEEVARREAVLVLGRGEERTLFVVDGSRAPIAGAAVISRVEGGGSSSRVLRVSDERGSVALPIPAPRAGDRRLVTFTFGGAARGEHVCPMAEVRDGMEIPAMRAKARTLRVTVTDANAGTELALASVRYSVLPAGPSASVDASGVMNVGIESAVEVPYDGRDSRLRLSWDSGPAISTPIPPEGPALEVKLPARSRITITNATDAPVEAFVTDLGRGEAWMSPILFPGTSVWVDASEDLRHHAVEVFGLAAGAASRVSFKASETAKIVVGPAGVKALSR